MHDHCAPSVRLHILTLADQSDHVLTSLEVWGELRVRLKDGLSLRRRTCRTRQAGSTNEESARQIVRE